MCLRLPHKRAYDIPYSIYSISHSYNQCQPSHFDGSVFVFDVHTQDSQDGLNLSKYNLWFLLLSGRLELVRTHSHAVCVSLALSGI